MTDLPERPAPDNLADYVDIGSVYRGFGAFISRPVEELVRGYIAEWPLAEQAEVLLDKNHYLVRQRVRTLGRGTDSSASSGPFVRADILQAMVDEKLIEPSITKLKDAEFGVTSTVSHVQTRLTERPTQWAKYAIAVDGAKNSGQER